MKIIPEEENGLDESAAKTPEPTCQEPIRNEPDLFEQPKSSTSTPVRKTGSIERGSKTSLLMMKQMGKKIDEDVMPEIIISDASDVIVDDSEDKVEHIDVNAVVITESKTSAATAVITATEDVKDKVSEGWTGADVDKTGGVGSANTVAADVVKDSSNVDAKAGVNIFINIFYYLLYFKGIYKLDEIER